MSARMTFEPMSARITFEPHDCSLLSLPAAGTLLTEDDFCEVYHQLSAKRVRRRPIGLHLGLPYHILENIEDQYRDNDLRLQNVVVTWLRLRGLHPTWLALMDALRHETVGDEGAAGGIREYVV